MYQAQIYHLYSAESDSVNYSIYAAEPKQGEDGSNFVEKIFKKLALWTFAVGALLLLFVYAPSVWYTVSSGGAKAISTLLSNTAKDSKLSAINQPVDLYQPKFDPKLAKDNHLKITSLGVDTTLVEATIENHEDALRKGVWRVSDFGTPFDREKPTILVAHRYGYLAWTNLFRRKSSFYALPKLEVGDTVEIVWKQRKYTYEIYAEGKGEEITDYNANLILYTCESLNSPIRIFKYARLLEI